MSPYSRLALALVASLAVSCARDTSLPPLPGPGTLYGRIVFPVPGQASPVPARDASVAMLGTSLATTSGSDGRFLLSGISQSTGLVLFKVDSAGTGVVDRQRLIRLRS